METLKKEMRDPNRESCIFFDYLWLIWILNQKIKCKNIVEYMMKHIIFGFNNRRFSLVPFPRIFIRGFEEEEKIKVQSELYWIDI